MWGRPRAPSEPCLDLRRVLQATEAVARGPSYRHHAPAKKKLRTFSRGGPEYEPCQSSSQLHHALAVSVRVRRLLEQVAQQDFEDS